MTLPPSFTINIFPLHKHNGEKQFFHFYGGWKLSRMCALKPEGNNYRKFYDITEHDVCQPLDETDTRNAYTPHSH